MIFALPRFTTLHALLAMLLVAVLVLAQTLGVIHLVTHAPSGSSIHSQHDGVDHTHGHADIEVHSSSHFLASLFSSHQDLSDCRLYDQASHDGGLAAAIQLLLPVVLPPLTVAIFQGEALARWAALFDARGPPLPV